MKKLLLLISILFSGSVLSRTYECVEHPSWPDDRKFSAKVVTSVLNDKIQAKVLSLNLSEDWPLDSKCDSPKVEMKLVGVFDGNELKLSLENGKECGFIIYISAGEKNPAMLSPRKSYKVFGESPYLAKCNVL